MQQLLRPQHIVLRLQLDLQNGRLRGRAIINGTISSKATSFGLHSRGAIIDRVEINGAAATFEVVDTLSALTVVAPPETSGLELYAVAHAEATADDSSSSSASLGEELLITIPESISLSSNDDDADEHFLMRIVVDYHIIGNNGALRFATDEEEEEEYEYPLESSSSSAMNSAGSSSSHHPSLIAHQQHKGQQKEKEEDGGKSHLHYAFTALKPESIGAVLGKGLGPRCVFPCIDAPGVSCTYDMRISIATPSQPLSTGNAGTSRPAGADDGHEEEKREQTFNPYYARNKRTGEMREILVLGSGDEVLAPKPAVGISTTTTTSSSNNSTADLHHHTNNQSSSSFNKMGSSGSGSSTATATPRLRSGSMAMETDFSLNSSASSSSAPYSNNKQSTDENEKEDDTFFFASSTRSSHGNNSSSLVTKKVWRFVMRTPVPASAVGFVAGPLVAVEKLEYRHLSSTANRSAPTTTTTTTTASTSASSSASTADSLTASSSGSSSAVSDAAHNTTNTTLPSASTSSSNIQQQQQQHPHQAEKQKTFFTHYASSNHVENGTAAAHVKRTRRMVTWVSDWLRMRFPFNAHRWVFLPSSVLHAIAPLYTVPHGFAPADCSVEGAAVNGGSSTGALSHDVYSMAGLVLLPDSLLTSTKVVDTDVTTHRAQVFGLVSSWIGCLVSISSWTDAWLIAGITRYITSLYLRSFRGEAEYEMEVARAIEAVAKLEEEYPSLLPLHVLYNGPSSSSSSSSNDSNGKDAAAAATVSAAVASAALVSTIAGVESGASYGGVGGAMLAPYPLAVSHPFRDLHVALKSGVVCHIFSVHIGEGRMRDTISAFLRCAAPMLLDAHTLQDQLQLLSHASQRQQQQQQVALLSSSSSGGNSVDLVPSSSSMITASASSAKLPSSQAALVAAAAGMIVAGTGSNAAADAGTTSGARTIHFSTSHFLKVIRAAAGETSQRVVDALDSLAAKWIRGRGVPQFHIGIEYYPARNSVNIVVEQILRPGSSLFRGEMVVNVYEKTDSPSSSSASGRGSLSTSALASAASYKAPDVWAHTITISKVRETFTLPCHSRSAHAGVAVSIRTYKKRGRPTEYKTKKKKAADKANNMADVSASTAAAAAMSRALVPAGDRVGDPDEVNGTPVEYVRLDPLQGWFKRVHVTMPPSMAISALAHDASALARIEAMRSLAGSLAPDALSVPGSVFPMPSDGASFPVVTQPPYLAQDAFAPEIEKSMRLDVRAAPQILGYQLRPTNPLTPLLRLAAVVAGLDAMHAKGTPKPGGTGAAAAAAAAGVPSGGGGGGAGGGGGRSRGSSSQQAAAAAAAVAAAALAAAEADAENEGGIGSSGSNITLHFLVRIAAAHCVARWTSGSLPGHGKPSVTGHSSYAGLGGILALYQLMYYEQCSYLPPSAVAAAHAAADAAANAGTKLPPFPARMSPLLGGGGGSGGGSGVDGESNIKITKKLTPSSLAALLSCFSRVTEEELLEFAKGGVPGAITITSLSHYQVRRALLSAIATIRHPDGISPDSVIAFLTNVLRSYDSHAIADVVDDVPLVNDIVIGLGQALVDSDGSRRIHRVLSQHTSHLESHAFANTSAPKPASWSTFLPEDPTGTLSYVSVGVFKAGVDTLREQLALELTSLRYHQVTLSAENAGKKRGLDSHHGGQTTQQHLSSSSSSSPPSAGSIQATEGLVAAAALASLCLLENNKCAPPNTLSLLRAYVQQTHPRSGHKVPQRLRVAAFAALARALLVPSSTSSASSSQQTQQEQHLSCWLTSFETLLQIVASQETHAQQEALLQILYVLHARTDRLHDEDSGNNNNNSNSSNETETSSASSSSSSHQVDSFVVERLRADLRRAMVVGRDVKADVEAIISGSSSSSSAVSSASRTYSTRWTFSDAAADLGIFDTQSEHMSLQERRLLGALRYSPAYSGCLSQVLQLPEGNASSSSSVSAKKAAITQKLWSFLSCLSSSGQAYHLLHSIFGLAPPIALRTASSSSGSSSSSTTTTTTTTTKPSLDDEMTLMFDSFTDARRDAIVAIRTSARVTHLRAAMILASCKTIQQQTGTAEVVDEDEEEVIGSSNAMASAAGRKIGGSSGAGGDDEEYGDDDEDGRGRRSGKRTGGAAQYQDGYGDEYDEDGADDQDGDDDDYDGEGDYEDGDGDEYQDGGENDGEDEDDYEGAGTSVLPPSGILKRSRVAEQPSEAPRSGQFVVRFGR